MGFDDEGCNLIFEVMYHGGYVNVNVIGVIGSRDGLIIRFHGRGCGRRVNSEGFDSTFELLYRHCNNFL